MKKILTFSVLACCFLSQWANAQSLNEQQTVDAARQARARAKAVQQNNVNNNTNDVTEIIFEPLIIQPAPSHSTSVPESQNTVNAARRANQNARELQQVEKDKSIFLTQPIPIIVPAPVPNQTDTQQTMNAAQRANQNAKALQEKQTGKGTQVLTVTPSGTILPAPRTDAQQTVNAAQRANQNAKALQEKQTGKGTVLTITPSGTILPAPRTDAQQTVNAAQRANQNAKVLQDKENNTVINDPNVPIIIVQPNGSLAAGTATGTTDAQRANQNAKLLQEKDNKTLVIAPAPTTTVPVSPHQKVINDAQLARSRARTNATRKENTQPAKNVIVIQQPTTPQSEAQATIDAARRAHTNAQQLTQPEVDQNQTTNTTDKNTITVVAPPPSTAPAIPQTEAEQTVEAARLARARAKAAALRKKNTNAVVVETPCSQISLGNAASQFGETGTSASVSTQGGIVNAGKCISK